MRWKILCRGLALLLAVVVVGCKQNVYLTEDDLKRNEALGLPTYLEETRCVGTLPITPLSAAPATILQPNRKLRYMSLAESIAYALEHGTIGNQSTVVGEQYGSGVNSVQTSTDQPVAFNVGTGGRLTGSDSIRVLRLDPAILGTGIESSLSKFDAQWTSSMNWTGTDRPIATAEDLLQSGGAGGAIVPQEATYSTSLLKPLPSGGVAGITFSNTYTNTNLQAAVNPSYAPNLTFQFEQPLLQGFGVDINQLRPSHPGSFLTPGVLNTQPTAEGILVTRLRFDEARAELEQNVHIMVLNVELAYWNLYYGYWNLYAQEQGLRFAYEAWKISESKFKAGRINRGEFAQARGQYETFRAQRLQALNDTLELERQFRAMIGVQEDNCDRIVPSDQPTLANYTPDWCKAVNEALRLRPELELARQEVRAAQMNLLVQKDTLLPDLRFGATYSVDGIGPRLDGGSPNNALQNLASNHFDNYTAQLLLNVPIGFRLAHSNVRIAQLELARAYETLADQERKITSYLVQQYRRLPQSYEIIRAQRASRESYAEQLRVQFEQYVAGRVTVDTLLEAQRFWATALSQEYLAIRDYNNALAGFEYAKGTMLVHNNVVIAEGALPCMAKQREIEHIKERDASLPILERPQPVRLESCTPAGVVNGVVTDKANQSLPNLFKEQPPLMDAPNLPAVPSETAPTPMPLNAAPNAMSAAPASQFSAERSPYASTSSFATSPTGSTPRQ